MPPCSRSRRPFTGAWIETIPANCRPMSAAVAPSRGRGSKRPGRQEMGLFRLVAPSRGRGSKPSRACRIWKARRVAPSRGRGSKRPVQPELLHLRVVAPSRGRGSKLISLTITDSEGGSHLHGGVDRNKGAGCIEMQSHRRPFTGAWIETSRRCCASWRHDCRPFTGAWIETDAMDLNRPFSSGSPLHGGVDRNDLETTGLTPDEQSPLHGGVDRNYLFNFVAILSDGRPFTGAWIETDITGG